ncbi:thioredoxin family protein [Paenibacillus sacheonensis]|uniref:Thioredoxin n=1 Tax=Paenibacillus sacheonensis TaxID=742054 RepID=A0A7X4YSP5_9BACL|nr:thioredoxin family protein [Paenibacillus sacheonensis]MBM7567164.1 thioredoxin-like negative regulator of GroEL [Paenibacillus sacheonensis]NBC70911.1 thioredoxin [Paenibacillus sacheonensis]
MALEEQTEREWLGRAKLPHEAVFFFTPLCGTCKVGLRMLEIVQAAGVDLPIVQININFAPALRDGWRVASVPALVLVRDGEPVQTEYAMQSVDSLYRLLKAFTP